MARASFLSSSRTNLSLSAWLLIDSSLAYYPTTLVFHGQSKSTSDHIEHLKRQIRESGSPCGHAIHCAPHIRREEDYERLGSRRSANGSAARAFRKVLKSPGLSMKMHGSRVSLKTNVAGYSLHSRLTRASDQTSLIPMLCSMHDVAAMPAGYLSASLLGCLSYSLGMDSTLTRGGGRWD